MRILVLNGSPKKKSDTFRLTDAFLKGLNRRQEHEVHIINVIEKDIAPCRGSTGKKAISMSSPLMVDTTLRNSASASSISCMEDSSRQCQKFRSPA